MYIPFTYNALPKIAGHFDIEELLAHGTGSYLNDALEQTAFSAVKKAGFGSEIRRLLYQVEPRKVSCLAHHDNCKRSVEARVRFTF